MKTQTKVYSRADRTDFRWPFFAYTLSNNILVVNYLKETDIAYYYQVPFDDI